MRFACLARLAPLPLLVTVAACSADGSDGSVASDSQLTLPTTAPEPICTKAGFCWSNPLPFGTNLRRVTGTASDRVWAVGAGELFAWDGKRWSMAEHPLDYVHSAVIGKDGRLWLGGHDKVASLTNGEWTTIDSPIEWNELNAFGDSVCAIGQREVGCLANGTWTRTEVGPPFPGPPGSGSYPLVHLEAIASHDDTLWIGGGFGWSPWAASLDAKNGLATMEDPFPAGGGAWPGFVNAMWVAGEKDVWATQEGHVHHFDGTAWTETADLKTRMSSLEGPAANDLLAVGDGGNAYRGGGKFWTKLDTQTNQKLLSSWRQDGQGWIVGDTGTLLQVRGEHVDPYTVTASTDNVTAGWGSADDDVYALAGKSLLHFDGSHWGFVSLPPSDRSLRTIAGSARDNVWITRGKEALHFDGTAWTSFDLGDTCTSTVVLSKREAWFATRSGVVMFDGYGPRLISPNVYRALTAAVTHDVWGMTYDSIDRLNWVTLEFEHVYVTPDVAGYEARIDTIVAAARDDIWAVGIGLYHWDGIEWSVASKDEFDASSIHIAGPKDIWLGSASKAIHWKDGARVDALTIPTGGPGDSYDQRSLGLIGTPTSIWTFGTGGAILRRAK